jgi:glycerophosphoryl diester phosphodiesterase
MLQKSLIASTLAVVGGTLVLSACGGSDSNAEAWPPTPTVIAHRGASALRPEHTLAAYQKAIDDGADIIEPDLVITKDGVLVDRHENALCILNADGSVREATTNVAELPEFASRKTTKLIDGTTITGWFAEDFTLLELKTLRARERIPAIRPGNVQYNDQFQIPTLQEVIDLAKAQTKATGRTIGIEPETKHPSYFKSIGLPLEAPLLATLEKNGWNSKSAPVFVQSFEVSNLKEIVTNALALGLAPHIWTLRPENNFLPASLKAALTTDPTVRGDSITEIQTFLKAGVDGFFTDDPAVGRAAVNGLKK